jgi:ADP-ribose pyrophosphatase YjhB (NUDIX family)
VTPAIPLDPSRDGRMIRPIAIAVVRNGDRILVGHGFDSVTQQHVVRPPGGGIDFGERAVDAVQREFREELKAELAEPNLLGVLEFVSDFQGEPCHEIVFVFEARFADPGLNDRAEFILQEGVRYHRASWMPLAELAAGTPAFHPNGLFELLARA